MHEAKAQHTGQFAFTTKIAGEYQACFSTHGMNAHSCADRSGPLTSACSGGKCFEADSVSVSRGLAWQACYWQLCSMGMPHCCLSCAFAPASCAPWIAVEPSASAPVLGHIL
jgi:hypothetical protein